MLDNCDRSQGRQGEDIIRCRRMISSLISVLEQYVELAEGTISRQELDEAWLLGSKETVLTALTRLVQMLERVTALEAQWQEIQKQEQHNRNTPLAAHEWELLLRYMEKNKKAVAESS